MSDEGAAIRYAGPGPRVSAQLIDLGILLAIALPLSFAAPYLGKYWILCYAAQLMVAGAYYPLFHAHSGQTPGKRMKRLELRSMSNGTVKWTNALLRSSVELCLAGLHSFIVVRAWLAGTVTPGENAASLAHAIGVLPGIDSIGVVASIWFWSEFVTMMFNGERRSLQDLIGQTIVVEVATTA